MDGASWIGGLLESQWLTWAPISLDLLPSWLLLHSLPLSPGNWCSHSPPPHGGQAPQQCKWREVGKDWTLLTAPTPVSSDSPSTGLHSSWCLATPCPLHALPLMNGRSGFLLDTPFPAPGHADPHRWELPHMWWGTSPLQGLWDQTLLLNPILEVGKWKHRPVNSSKSTRSKSKYVKISVELTTLKCTPTLCQCKSLYLHLICTHHWKVEIGAPAL